MVKCSAYSLHTLFPITLKFVQWHIAHIQFKASHVWVTFYKCFGKKLHEFDMIWESLIWPLSPRIIESAGSTLTIGTLVERGGSKHPS